jgi:uncharacterized protein YggE
MTFTTRIFLTSLLLFTTVSINSQSSSFVNLEQPYIEVTGTAEREVIPDEIYLSINIRERYVNKLKISIEEQEEKLKSVLKSLGIDLKNLYLSDAEADYVKVYRQKKDVLSTKNYNLKVINAASVGQVFGELDKLEITEAYICKVSHSKMEILKIEVKTQAIKSAKDKADYLVSALGEQLGKPLVIKEHETQPIYIDGINLRGARANSFVANSEPEDEIQFQKIKIQASIYVKFAIE